MATTITAMTMNPGAVLDVDSNPNTVTITTLTIKGKVTINDRNGKLLVTNAIANWSNVTFNGTPGRAVTLSAP